MMTSSQPIPSLSVSGITLNIAESDCPDAGERWQRVGDHLAAWLIAEWEREQQESQQQVDRTT